MFVEGRLAILITEAGGKDCKNRCNRYIHSLYNIISEQRKHKMTSSNQKDQLKHQIKEVYTHNKQKNQSRPTLAFLIEKIQNCRPSVVKRKHLWTTEEQIKYLVFVYYSSDILKDSTNKDLWVAFNLMTKFLPTKNPNQCRIFHKQMMKKFENVQKMLKFIETEVPEFSSIAQAYKRQLKMKTIQSKGQQQNLQNIANQKGKTGLTLEAFSKWTSKEVVSKQADQFPVFQGFHQNEKDEKQQNIRTDITYKESNACTMNNRTSIDSSTFQAPLQPYCMDQSLNTFNNSNFMTTPIWTSFTIPPNEFSQSLMLIQIAKKQQQWQECHALYVAWTQKLMKLMSFQQ